MNDWEMTKFLKFIISFQLLILIISSLDTFVIDIPIIREIIGFIYLTFIPGILILRILKIHEIGNIETLLYSVGLSLTILMITGFIMNFIYPLLGILKPISLYYLLITISGLVTVLIGLSYIIDKNFLAKPSNIKIPPKGLFIALIPFLAIFGTYMVNFYNSNILLLVLIFGISLIVILAVFDKIPKYLYPLTIFIIAISLLYHNSLISIHLTGWDIHMEYYLSNLVVNNSYWNPNVPTQYNAMLSLVMIAPIMSIITGMDVTMVLKIIYPFIFALVPLGLYKVFQSQTNEKVAFLSCFFFVSLFIFYTEMTALARQEIAELFLVLILALMINRSINRFKKSILFASFAFSIIVSHYGLSFIFMVYLITAWLILFVMDKSLFKKFDPFPGYKLSSQMFNLNFAFLFIAYTFTWYMYTSDAYTFNIFVKICKNFLGNLFINFLNFEFGKGLQIVTSEISSPIHIMGKFIHVISQLFILIGFTGLMFKINKMKFKKDFFPLVLISLIILLLSIAVPNFANILNTTRLYHISLIFLAPFVIIGGIIVLKNILEFKLSKINDFRKNSWKNTINNSFKISGEDKKSSRYLKTMSIFVVVFFLFNSGFIYEIINDHPTSYSISQNNLRNSNNAQDRGQLYGNLNTFTQDKFAASWFSHKTETGPNNWIYADVISTQLLMDYGIGKIHGYGITLNTSTIILPKTYVFLGYANTIGNVMLIPKAYDTRSQYKFNDFNLIYSNGADEIYLRNN